MEKIMELQYCGGSSRNGNYAVDWMLVNLPDGNELYAEAKWSTEDEGRDGMEEQVEVFWTCLTALSEQADERGIDLLNIKNIDFEQYGNPIDYWNFADIPDTLLKYLGKYWD